MIFQVVVLIYIFVEWTFPELEPEEEVNVEVEDEGLEETEYEESEREPNY